MHPLRPFAGNSQLFFLLHCKGDSKIVPLALHQPPDGKYPFPPRDARVRREKIRIYSVPHYLQFFCLQTEALWRCGKNGMREKNRDAQLQINAFVRIPERDAFPPQSPEKAAKDDIFGIHVHKDGVVVVTQSPDEREKSKRIHGTACRTVLFPERMDVYGRGERIRPFFETNDFDTLDVLRKLLHPTAKEPEDGVVNIYSLSDYQQLHPVRNYR